MTEPSTSKINNITAVVERGNIATGNADCIVVPEFNNCASRGGVGYAIESEGMSAGLDEYDKIAKGKTLEYGDAVITESGKKGVKLSHVVTAGALREDQLEAVQASVLQTLISANAQGLKRIAVPELGTGIIGSLTQEQAAQAIFNAVHVFSKENPDNKIEEVSLIVYRGSTVPAEKVLTDKSYLDFNNGKAGEKEFNMGEWLEGMASSKKTKEDIRERIDTLKQNNRRSMPIKEDKYEDDAFYTIDREHNIIIYDSDRNYDGHIDVRTMKMAKIAAREQMTVETEFNGAKFRMTPGMTPEQGYKEFEKEMERKREEYRKSPKYQADQIAAKQREAKQKLQEAEDNKLIKDESLNLDGHKRYWTEMVEKNVDKFKSTLQFAERWGKVMQAEMKKQGLEHLTPEMVKETRLRADIYGMSGTTAALARNLLVMSWKHGEELAKIEGFEDMTEVAMMRAIKSDRVKLFYDTYRPSVPKDFDDAVKKAGQVIAAVLQDEALVKKFGEKLASPRGFSEEELQEYIPVLKLPDNDWRTLHNACHFAIKNIKEVKANTNEGNGRPDGK